MPYVPDTRNGYQSAERAAAYRRQQTSGLSWARLTTWHQRRIVRQLVNEAASAGGVVVDVPCGTGVLVDVLAEQQRLVIGVDVSSEMLSLARTDHQTVCYVRGDITHLPFGDESVQCLVVVGLFHRLPASVRAQALAELRRVSAGHVIASFSIDGPWHRAKRRLLRSLRPRHKSPPYPIAAEQALEELRRAALAPIRRARVAFGISTDQVFLLHCVPPVETARTP